MILIDISNKERSNQMTYLEQYGKLQEEWLSKITKDISKMKQILPYY